MSTTAPHLVEAMALLETLDHPVGLSSAFFEGRSIRASLLVAPRAEYLVDRYASSAWGGSTPTGEGRTATARDIGSRLEAAYAELVWAVRSFQAGELPPTNWPLDLPKLTTPGPPRPALESLLSYFWREVPRAMLLVAVTERDGTTRIAPRVLAGAFRQALLDPAKVPYAGLGAGPDPFASAELAAADLQQQLVDQRARPGVADRHHSDL